MSDERGLRKLHWALGALFCLVLPGASWLDGTGRLSYTMFADVHWVRVEVVAFDGSGRARAISPTLVANGVGGSAAVFFAGADRFHLAPVSRTPRRHLDDVARFTCTLVKDAVRIEVHLLERETEDGPIVDTTGAAKCE